MGRRPIAVVVDGMKECRCKRHDGPNPLPVSEFDKNAQTASGYHDHCKRCRRRTRRAWTRENREHCAALMREWRWSRLRELRVLTKMNVFGFEVNVVGVSPKRGNVTGWTKACGTEYKVSIANGRAVIACPMTGRVLADDSFDA